MSENVEIVERLVARFFEGPVRVEDLTDDALEQFFDPNVEWLPDPHGMLARNSYLGFEGIRLFAADFVSAWDEISADPPELREADGRVVAILRVSGRMHELEIDELWSGLYTFRNGRILRFQGFTSRDGALEAAGLRE